MMPKPTIPEVLPMVRAYVAKPGNSVGGALHIVLADKNVGDASVRFCLDWARARGDTDGEHLVATLLRMSRTQRGKLARIF